MVEATRSETVRVAVAAQRNATLVCLRAALGLHLVGDVLVAQVHEPSKVGASSTRSLPPSEQRQADAAREAFLAR